MCPGKHTPPPSGTVSTWIVICFLEMVLSEMASWPAGQKSKISFPGLRSGQEENRTYVRPQSGQKDRASLVAARASCLFLGQFSRQRFARVRSQEQSRASHAPSNKSLSSSHMVSGRNGFGGLFEHQNVRDR
jgi:hypothetical protein